jgi:hypothetical protein
MSLKGRINNPKLKVHLEILGATQNPQLETHVH